MPDTFDIIHEGITMPVRMKRNKRARRLILRLDQHSEGGVLTLPPGATQKDAQALARENAEWLYSKLQERPPREAFEDGQTLSLLGETIIIRHAPERRAGVELIGGTLVVSGREEHLSRRVLDWLKKHAREVVTPRAVAMAARLDRQVGRISIRNTRSRWGSCSHTGNLSFCWRLILTPEWILDYVIAHEVSHLVHMNHSPAFWKTVRTFDVDPDGARTWLGDNGPRLQRIGP